MTSEQKVQQYYADYAHIEPAADNSIGEFCKGLAKYLGCSTDCALDIWYARQRSWFRPEMIQALIDLDSSTDPMVFRPCLPSGEFVWDVVNKKFIPERS